MLRFESRINVLLSLLEQCSLTIHFNVASSTKAVYDGLCLAFLQTEGPINLVSFIFEKSRYGSV